MDARTFLNGAAKSESEMDTQTIMRVREEARAKQKDELTTSAVRAMGEHVAIRPKARPSVTKAGIHLPDEEGAPANQYGIVLSIGPAVDPIKCPIAEGDEVVIGKYIEVQPDVGGHKVCLLPWQAVLGKVER